VLVADHQPAAILAQSVARLDDDAAGH
jgi:hypothetical protein